MESGGESTRETGGRQNETLGAISSGVESTDAKASAATDDASNLFSKDWEVTAPTKAERFKSRDQVIPKIVPSSPDKTGAPSANKPPRVPTQSVVRRRPQGRSAYSKPKLRLLEPSSYPIEISIEEKNQVLPCT